MKTYRILIDIQEEIRMARMVFRVNNLLPFSSFIQNVLNITAYLLRDTNPKKYSKDDFLNMFHQEIARYYPVRIDDLNDYYSEICRSVSVPIFNSLLDELLNASLLDEKEEVDEIRTENGVEFVKRKAYYIGDAPRLLSNDMIEIVARY